MESKLESANMSHGSSFLSLQVSIAPPQLSVPPLQMFLQVAAATLLQVSATPPSPSLYYLQDRNLSRTTGEAV